MPGKAGFRVRPKWPRPASLILDAFGAASPAQIADAMSRLGAMDAGIRPIWPSPRVIGAALTVWCHSGDNLMLHQAIAHARPGDILIVNTQGNVNNAPFGELIATAALAAGIRAVIVDGVVRDAGAIQALQLPCYARGLSPNSCHKDGPGEVGAIVSCGGVAVRPGDIVIADRDGVTVVPLDDAEPVARLAVAQIDKEEKRKSEISQGVLVRPEITETLRRLKVLD